MPGLFPSRNRVACDSRQTASAIESTNFKAHAKLVEYKLGISLPLQLILEKHRLKVFVQKMSNVLETKTPTVRSADGTLIWATSAGRPATEAPVIVFVPGFSMSSLVFRKQFEDQDLLKKYCLVSGLYVQRVPQ